MDCFDVEEAAKKQESKSESTEQGKGEGSQSGAEQKGPTDHVKQKHSEQHSNHPPRGKTRISLPKNAGESGVQVAPLGSSAGHVMDIWREHEK